MEQHIKYFMWEDGDDNAIDVAFGSDPLPRKKWMNRIAEMGEHDNYLKAKSTSYASFINNELVFYARADLQRSLPSLLDGLTKVRRKILFGLLVDNDMRSNRIDNLIGTVSERTSYKHGPRGMSEAVIKMSQDYAGSNNIPLLIPLGTLDSNETHGKDHYSTDRYVHVKLNSITRLLFLEEDDKFLNYLNEDGKSIEPYCYQPILPMILVNGCKGIAVGWSSNIPNYKPSDIIKNIKKWLMDKPLDRMTPWYKGFSGTIKEDPNKVGSFLVKGDVRIKDETTFLIVEIPFTKSKKDYEEFLTSITEGPRGKTRQIKSFEEEGNGFKIDLIQPKKTKTKKTKKTEKSENSLEMESLIEEFDLQTSISINNMHLLDENMNLKKYDTEIAILEEFLAYRLVCYEKKKTSMVDQLKHDMESLDHKIKFIKLWQPSRDIKKAVELFKKYLSEEKPKEQLLEKEKLLEEKPKEQLLEKEELLGENPKEPILGDDYNYLLSMPINTFYDDSLQRMESERKTKEKLLETMQKTTPKEMYLKDIEKISTILSDL
ncbi:DNA topoisomerase 2-like isoform X2 [Vicia villosa]|nr:DNA topoisomerase 2-like isoform X2 [Vicia villosa]